MPVEAGKEQPEGRRSEDRSQCVAFLEDSGECAAALFRQGFKSQRGAHTPFAAHGNSEQRPQHQQHIERGRKGAGQFDHGEAEDICHQHGTAAIAVGQHAEEQSADWTKGLREEYRAQNRGGLGAELAGNRVDAKDEQKEVEAIERPAEKCGQKDMALRAGELAKRSRKERTQAGA